MALVMANGSFMLDGPSNPPAKADAAVAHERDGADIRAATGHPATTERRRRKCRAHWTHR